MKVDNLWPALAFAMEFYNVKDKLADGNLAEKLVAGYQLTDEAIALVQVDWDKANEERKALTDEGKAELNRRAAAKLELANDRYEGQIEEAVSLALDGVAFFSKVENFVNKVRA